MYKIYRYCMISLIEIKILRCWTEIKTKLVLNLIKFIFVSSCIVLSLLIWIYWLCVKQKTRILSLYVSILRFITRNFITTLHCFINSNLTRHILIHQSWNLNAKIESIEFLKSIFLYDNPSKTWRNFFLSNNDKFSAQQLGLPLLLIPKLGTICLREIVLI